ncbi:hypothetical protein U9M48_014662 [Paspalum notatum var. saurae]|uniref:Uncharacterized protein n=1 Tax=Paspalum notatum var. saurae TaxID=547442 RepID=A0AAQ3T4U7_PASNO
MPGRKRPASFLWEGRPQKLARQGDGMSCVTDAMDYDFDECGAMLADDAGASAGAGSSSGCLFINASSAAVAAFDFSELTGVVLLEELHGVQEPRNAPPADVYVPGAAWSVPIPKQVILCQILGRLRLQLHGFGAVIEPCGMVRGWLEVDTPPSGVHGVRGRQRFVGGQRSTNYDAIESACFSVIAELSVKHDVIVKDLNFGKVKRMEKKLRAANEWDKLFRYMLDMKDEELKKIKRDYDSLLMEVKSVCKKFGDVLPVRCSGLDDSKVDCEDAMVMYAGVRPPVFRFEELAYDLVAVISKASAAAAEHGGMV